MSTAGPISPSLPECEKPRCSAHARSEHDGLDACGTCGGGFCDDHIDGHERVCLREKHRRETEAFHRYTWLSVPVLLVVGGAIAWFCAAQEAAAYNRLTGGNATTWDALFVELRVDGDR